MKSVFIHIPKTAGSSIRDVMQTDWNPNTHQIASQYQDIFGEEWENIYSFAFIRNPWARTVSIYNMLYSHCSEREHFRNWLRIGAMETFSRGQVQPWIPQVSFICRNGEQIVSFVGSFEHLERDWTDISKKLNLPSDLPHLNCSKPVSDYREYYDDEGRNLVATRLSADIEFGRYSF